MNIINYFSKNKNNKKNNEGLGKYRKFSKKQIKKIVLWTLGIILCLSIVLFAWYSKDLPTPGNIKNRTPAQSTQILDRDGKVLYDIHGEEKRTVVESSTIPQDVKNATVAAEDKNFYKHMGVDFTGIARALYRDIFHHSDVLQGGSTITQQYVKNALLTTKQTFDRKIKELILSLELEAMYSKDEILTMYLNEIPYGSNAYGIEAASQTFYKKSVKDLTLDEAATLAALPNAPTYYSPYGTHPDALKTRRDYILDRMVELKYITQDQAKEAKDKKIEVVEQDENITAPHFVLYVKEKLVEMYGEEKVTEGGLKVTTTLDINKQKAAEEAVKNGYEKNLSMGASNAALVSLDPKTGQILAMVGSHDFFDTENDGQVNVTVSDRQPGSSFKPIVYATGFKGKYSPSSVLWDVKTDFGNYTPSNYNGKFNGPVTIRFALSNSLNIPAVKMLALVGIDSALETAHEMGITTLNDGADQYGLSLVLGGGEVKPIDMATAFSVFANKGVKNETTPFLKIEDSQGKILYQYELGKNQKQVLDPQIAYEISSILSDNDARSTTFGSNSYLHFSDRTVAAKTGTTESFHDAWTVGYTPSLATAVWVGNNNNDAMSTGADGSVVAAPIFHEYMQNALSGQNNEEFERPSGITDFTVDKLSGKIPTDQSSDKLTDIFASWQIPKDYDDIHVKVKICKVCSDVKLADENCPPSQIEERIYTNLHSEKPNDSNWENPVRLAAEALGMSLGTPPKDVCDVNSVKPSISISSPSNGASVSGNFTIQTNPNATNGIAVVEIFIDNVKVASLGSPYSTTYNANNLSTGSHELIAKVIDNKDVSTTSKITINTTKDTSAPNTVSGVSLNPGSKYINISWTNPSDNDLSSVRVYSSTTQGSLGSLVSDTTASASSSSTASITGLNSNTTYYFTLRPVDKNGNENGNTTQYSAKAQ